jgi:uncharacterized membrane protein
MLRAHFSRVLSSLLSLMVWGLFAVAPQGAQAAQSIVTSPDVANTQFVTEGGNLTVNVRLNESPGGNVTITAARTGGDTDINVSPGARSYLAAQWGFTQSFTFSAADDADANSDRATFTLTAALDSAPTTAIATATVTLQERDNDLAIVTNLTAPAPYTFSVIEGATGTVKVKLNGNPGEGVSVTVTPSKSGGDGDLSITAPTNPATLTFTKDNWNADQDVVITAAEENPGNQDALNGVAAMVLSSPGLASINFTTYESDNDLRFEVDKDRSSTPDLDPVTVTVAENSSNDYLWVRLAGIPAGSVTATITWFSGDADIAVDPASASVSFSTSTWADWKRITIHANEDTDARHGTAVVRISSAGWANRDVTIKEADNDQLTFEVDHDASTPGVIESGPAIVPENGTKQIRVRLTANPVDSPVLATFGMVAGGDTHLSMTSPLINVFPIQFGAGNWIAWQTITLRAAEEENPATPTIIEDDAIDGTAILRLSDSSPNAITAIDVNVVEDDNDTLSLRTNFPNENCQVAVSTGLDDPATGYLEGATALNLKNLPRALVVDDILIKNYGLALPLTYVVLTPGAYNSQARTQSVVITPELVFDNTAFIRNTNGYALGATTLHLGGVVMRALKVNDRIIIGETTYTIASVVARANSLEQDVTIANPGLVGDVSDNAPVFIESSDYLALHVNEQLQISPYWKVPEGGTNTTPRVWLNLNPGMDVEVKVTRNLDADGQSHITVTSGMTLNFNSTNWDITKQLPFTLTAHSDLDATDSYQAIRYDVRVKPTGAADSAWVEVPSMVRTDLAREDDDEVAGLVVSKTQMVVPEEGVSEFTVCLNAALNSDPLASEPVVTVQLGIIGDDENVGELGFVIETPNILTFTPEDWGVPQTVRVRLLPDEDAALTPSVSNRTARLGIICVNWVANTLTAEVALTEIDDDCGVEIDTDNDDVADGHSVVVIENRPNSQGEYHFKVRMRGKPEHDCAVQVARYNGDFDITIDSGALLQFTPDNWDVWQPVALKATDDADVTANSTIIRAEVRETCSITTSPPPSSLPPALGDSRLYLKAVNDALQVGDRLTKGGRTYTVVTAGILFEDKQTVTITPSVQATLLVNDQLVVARMGTGLVTGQVAQKLELVNPTDVITTMSGATIATKLLVGDILLHHIYTYTITKAVYGAQPSAAVYTFDPSLKMTMNDGDALDIRRPQGWIPADVMAIEQEDDDAREIQLDLNGDGIADDDSDPGKDGWADEDTNGDGIWDRKCRVSVAEGTAQPVRIRLRSEPPGGVTVTIRRLATGDTDLGFADVTGVCDTTTLLITPSNYSLWQTVDLTALADADGGHGRADFEVTAPTWTPINFEVVEVDSTLRQIKTNVNTLVIPEGTSQSFTVKLSARPNANETVTVSVSAVGDADINVVTGAQLAFTAGNWDQPQTVTVSADADYDALVGTATISCTASGWDAANVNAAELDDDQQLIMTDTTDAIEVTEGTTAEFGVYLSAQPMEDVSVQVAPTGNSDENLVIDSGATLLFTPTDWAQPKLVRILAENDVDSLAGTATITCSADGWTSVSLTVTEVDDDLYQPDLLIKAANAPDSAYQINNQYTGIQEAVQLVTPAGWAIYQVRLQNDGNNSDTYVITGSPAPAGWTVKYYLNFQDITGAMTGGGYLTSDIFPAVDGLDVRVEVQPGPGIPAGESASLNIIATSVGDAQKSDTVVAKTTAATFYQAETRIRNAWEMTYTGRLSSQEVSAGVAAIYHLRLTNTGNTADQFTVTGVLNGDDYVVRCYDGLSSATQISNGWTTPTMAKGAIREFRLEVVPTAQVNESDYRTVVIEFESVNNLSVSDAVTATTTRQQDVHKPDLLLRVNGGSVSYTGDNLFTTTATDQKVEGRVVSEQALVFELLITNKGNLRETFTLAATAAPAGWTVAFFDAHAGGLDITQDVLARRWQTALLGIFASQEVRVELMPPSTTTPGTTAPLSLTVTASDATSDVGQIIANVFGRTMRVNVSTAGTQALGGDSRLWCTPTMSDDGAIVVFASQATNLVLNDTNAKWDVFRHNRLTGETTRVSLGLNNAETNGDSGMYGVAVSGDGRFVAYRSGASNIVQDDTNAKWDIFRYDSQTGDTVLVSRATTGQLGNRDSGYYGLAISGDGQFIAFESTATNLVNNDTNAVSDIFLRNVQAGVTERVSLTDGDTQAAGSSQYPALSASGRFVAFNSAASNLTSDDSDTTTDVFLRDRVTGQTLLVSRATGGTGMKGNNRSALPSISADGRWIAFESTATNLVASADTNNASDVFVRDMQTLSTRRVSQTPLAGIANGASQGPSISADGQYIVFRSKADNLLPGGNTVDTNLKWDVFIAQPTSNIIERASVAGAGTQANSDSGSFGIAVNADGSHIAFWSAATNLVDGDTNALSDIFIRTRSYQPLQAVYLSATPITPQWLGTSITLTATARGGTNLQYRFRQAYQSGTSWIWSTIRDFATVNTCTWTPNSARSWRVKVEAQTIGQSTSVASAEVTYTINTLSVLTDVTMSMTPPGPKPLGTTVAFDATATGGGNTVQYQFRQGYLSGASMVWTTLQAYSATATYTWHPTSARTWTLEVGAKAGSTEVTRQYTYVIQAAPAITSVTLQSSKLSPQPLGASIPLEAIVSGGGNVEYKFFQGYLSGTSWTWLTIRDYAPGHTFTWIPAEARSWTLRVFVREIGSTAVYTKYATKAFAITGTVPLSSVRLAVQPPSPSPLGNRTLTATPTGGNGLQYWFRYRMKINGVWGSWTNITPTYSSSNQATWTPPSSGVFNVVVNARESAVPSVVKTGGVNYTVQ